jgi:hypothetical protein
MRTFFPFCCPVCDNLVMDSEEQCAVPVLYTECQWMENGTFYVKCIQKIKGMTYNITSFGNADYTELVSVI